MYTKPTITGFRRQNKYENYPWELPADSKLRQAGEKPGNPSVNKLSTRAQHNLQVNLYRRMFENMGYCC